LLELHADTLNREQLILRYLTRKLDANVAERFEAHYIECRDCYEELRATELLIYGLGQIVVDRSAEDVAIVRFAHRTELTNSSLDLRALLETVRVQNESKVLIDLANVSRIDSAGLGMLMNCYCHAVRNRGMLKLLNPNAQVKKVLNVTKIDSLLPALDDERAAVESFGSSDR
jgi:anti-anti-sigma factor